MANDLRTDAFIRIHANSSTNPETEGILTICQTPNNAYNGELYDQSKALSEYVLETTVKAAGAEKRHVWENDTMTGINWCQRPVTIVEMGYMSNENEDVLLSSEEYRWMLARGIANGIDDYFENVYGG